MEFTIETLKQIVSEADTQLADFLEMGKVVGATLDFSIESITDVEKILRQTNATEDKDEDLFYDAWLYTGIAVQRSKIGTWIISEEDDETYGQPAVKYPNPYNNLFCPILEIRNFLKTKKPGDIVSSII